MIMRQRRCWSIIIKKKKLRISSFRILFLSKKKFLPNKKKSFFQVVLNTFFLIWLIVILFERCLSYGDTFFQVIFFFLSLEKLEETWTCNRGDMNTSWTCKEISLHGEVHTLGPGLTITAVSSGFSIGACAWIFDVN